MTCYNFIFIFNSSRALKDQLASFKSHQHFSTFCSYFHLYFNYYFNDILELHVMNPIETLNYYKCIFK